MDVIDRILLVAFLICLLVETIRGDMTFGEWAICVLLAHIIVAIDEKGDR